MKNQNQQFFKIGDQVREFNEDIGDYEYGIVVDANADSDMIKIKFENYKYPTTVRRHSFYNIEKLVL